MARLHTFGIAVLAALQLSNAYADGLTPLTPSNNNDGGGASVSPAAYETNIVDHSSSPSYLNFNSQPVPTVDLNDNNTTAAAGAVAGAPYATATINAASPTVTQSNNSGLIMATGTVQYNFEVSVNPSLGSSFTPAANVILDLSGMTAASGSGDYYADAYIQFGDANGLLGNAFESCSVGGGALGCGNIGGFTDTAGTPNYIVGNVTGGMVSFSFPVNMVENITIEATVTTFDDASSATASIDPTIAIDPSTPNSGNYVISQSPNTVPEPTSVALVVTAVTGLMGLVGRRRWIRSGGRHQSRQTPC